MTSLSPLANEPSRIVLIGLSGSGKSAAARQVARALHWEWGDSDDLIVSQDGRGIPQIFRDEGEDYFRRLERQAISQLVRSPHMVIATGGGAVLLPENRRRLWNDAFVVRLTARAETLAARLAAGTRAGEIRPLLSGGDAIARLRALQAEREPLYALADWTIQTDCLTSEAVAAEAVRAYRHYAPGLLEPHSRTEALDLASVPAAMSADSGAEIDDAAAVRTPGGSYAAVVGWGNLPGLANRLRHLGLHGRVSVITDRHVEAIHGGALLAALRSQGLAADCYALAPGEQHKSLDAAAPVFDWLIGRRAERGEAIIAFGGGVVTDLAGFVAATYLRGVPLVHVPTSLLGAMDAAIGGKVAVDHRQGKNLIGAFYQPRLVWIDASLLSSLPQRELTSGWAEVIKHGLIMAPDLVDYLEANIAAVRALEPEALLPALRRSVQLKARVVSADEREAGLRSTLNYGHTIGHALEAVTGYGSLLHGEAVAVGMNAAGEIAHRLGLLPSAELERQNRLITAYGLPLRWPGVDPDRVIAATALDKKVSGGAVRWVLLDGIGHTTLRSDVPLSLVREVVSGLLQDA